MKKTRYDELSQEEILNMEPERLMELVSERFRVDIPPAIDTPEEMYKTSRLLGRCASEYSYLLNMALLSRIRKRQMKRGGASRQDIEDALSREEVFQSFADIMKMAYNAISRMITVKQQVNEELRMTDAR